MPRPTPCLWFDGRAEEAAAFYTSVFPNSEIHGEMPGPDDRALTVDFTLDGQDFTGLNGGPQFTFTEAVSFQIICADQAEVDYYWDRLSEGGEEGPCGWLKDRFGLSWQVVPSQMLDLLHDPDPGRAQRAAQAMMGMQKLDVAELRRAADTQPASS